MCPGNRDHVSSVQDVLCQPLRPAGISMPCIQDGLEQRIATRDDVADDEHVGSERYLVRRPALDEFDARCSKLVTHRRVHIGITSRHAVPRLTGQCRQAAHEGAADSQDVNVHRSRF